MAVLSVCSVASAASDTWEGARVWSYRSFQKCRCCGLGEPMHCNRGMFGPWGHTRRGIFVPMPTVILFESAVKVAPESPMACFWNLRRMANGSSIARPTAWAVESSDLVFGCRVGSL